MLAAAVAVPAALGAGVLVGSTVAGAAPQAPTDLQASSGDGSVELSWTAPSTDSGDPVLGYDLYEGTSPDTAPATQLNASLVVATSEAVSGLADGRTYYFAVTAVTATGSSAPSDEASATPAAAGSTAVSDVVVTPASSLAGAATAYVVHFRTSAAGGLGAGDSLSLAPPPGTVMPSLAADYAVDGVPAASVTVSARPPGGSEDEAALVLGSATDVGSLALGEVTVNDVVNPPAASSEQLSLGVSSTQDAAVASSAGYTVGPAGALAGCSGSTGDARALVADVEAVATGGGSVALVSGCTYDLATAAAGSDALPEITGQVTLATTSGAPATIAASGSGFGLVATGPAAELTLDDVAVEGFDNRVTSGGSGTGTVDNEGVLSVNGGTFSGDAAGDGGAIGSGDGSTGATLAISDVTFSGDSGAVDGGAIDSGDNSGAGVAMVSGSTFSRDTSSDDGGAIDSGDNSASGVLTVSGSTFSGDSAGTDGGAIDSGDSGGSGTALVTESTFSGDQASFAGGAVDNSDGSGDATAMVLASTFAGNASGNGNGEIDSSDAQGGSLVLAADILADAGGPECDGTITDGGYNVADDGNATCSLLQPTTLADDGALPGELSALGVHESGSTETIEFDPASATDRVLIPATPPFVVAGFPICPGVDQNGTARPDGLAGGCAPGSVEYPASGPGSAVPAPPTSGPPAGGSAGGSPPAGASALLPQVITFRSRPPAAARVGDRYTLSATGGGSSSPVVFSVAETSSPRVCEVSGAVVRLLRPGACIVEATQAGGNGYAAAPPVTQRFTVLPAASVRLARGVATATGARVTVALRCSGATCSGTITLGEQEVIHVAGGHTKRVLVGLGLARFRIAKGRSSDVSIVLDARGVAVLRGARSGAARLAVAIRLDGRTTLWPLVVST